ncbi:MAG: Spo0B domain-containing protein [Clostridia bacterium]|nr:Spo0B domain-containing protein [Clostridia bacterium]
MQDDLIKKMLDCQKVMRHDFTNHIQIIYGYLQMGNVKKAEEHSVKAVEGFQRVSAMERIRLPYLHSFLIWYISSLGFEQNSFEVHIDENWDIWEEEDEELTKVLMQLLYFVRKGLISSEMFSVLKFDNNTPNIILLCKGSEKIIKGLKDFKLDSKIFVVCIESYTNDEIKFIIKK